MLLLTLTDIELRFHFPDGLLRLLFLQHLKELLISLELHIGNGLILEAPLVLILGLTLSLNELLLGHLDLFLSKLFLSGQSLFEGIFDLLDVLQLS